MQKINNLILIGGGSRNLGKTEFVTRLISNYKSKYEIIAIKIKTIYEGDSFFHGKDRTPLLSNYRITEFSNSNNNEDTSRMLKAGAERVFKIKSKNEYLGEAFDKLFNELNTSNKLIICESNSLRDFIIPNKFFLILGTNNTEIKPSAQRLLKFADKIIYSDGKKFDINIENITFAL